MGRRGFTLLELNFVVGIVGVLAAIAIPNYINYQLTAKLAGARINLAAIAHLEAVHEKEHGRLRFCGPSPAEVPGPQRAPFEPSPCWRRLGFDPGTKVRFQYRVVRTGPRGFEARARGDLDDDKEVVTLTLTRGAKEPSRAPAGVF